MMLKYINLIKNNYLGYRFIILIHSLTKCNHSRMSVINYFLDFLILIISILLIIIIYIDHIGI